MLYAANTISVLKRKDIACFLSSYVFYYLPEYYLPEKFTESKRSAISFETS